MGKIKFKMSFEKFSFEYEGDQEQAQRIQSGLHSVIESLSEAQNAVIDIEPKRILPAAQSSSNGSVTKKRKKGRSKNGDGSLPTANEGESTDTPRSPRAGKPLRPLLARLVQEGFFSERRPVASVREELAKKGHNFESRGIATGLLAFTRDEYLSRDNASGSWEYWEGPKEIGDES